jgi:hypothetical protein
MKKEQTTTDYTDWRRTIEALRRVPKLGGRETAAPCIFQFASIRACLAVALRTRVDSRAFRKSSHNAINRSARIAHEIHGRTRKQTAALPDLGCADTSASAIRRHCPVASFESDLRSGGIAALQRRCSSVRPPLAAPGALRLGRKAAPN